MKNTLIFTSVWLLALAAAPAEIDYLEPHPFGEDTSYAKDSDNVATGKWWEVKKGENQKEKAAHKWVRSIPRDQALAFAIYTHHNGVLKLSAQCFPLLPEESKTVVLELKKDGKWVANQEQEVMYPGWDVHFRVEGWDSSKDVAYRVRLGELSEYEGLIRKDPVDKDEITVAVMSCNSPRDKQQFTRTELVKNLLIHDPDLLFFGGDQNYTHDEGTFGWLQFGVQYRDVMRDRPTICIPDDHDIGHPNLWGEGGKQATKKGASDGGYLFPPSFVNMVERQQTWHLPDAYDPTPVKQGIGVYYTDLTLGGISFAILEDRKFKSGPDGKIPKMGPRPDHINDPNYDRDAINLPGLELLGERQLKFLDAWARDWTGADMKVALSQTAFCGAVHLHAGRRLLADLDCNGWPQAGRDAALRPLRAAQATHLCGDQHLAVVVKHGIESFRDGPMSFTSPALVNTVYGRTWWPQDEKAGGGETIQSPLPWTGDYEDGLGNLITMYAYANPESKKSNGGNGKGDGYGITRFNKRTGEIVFEAWPRFSDVAAGDDAQYPGWPIRFNVSENDGRKPVGYLKEVKLPAENAVVELTDTATGELFYVHRVKGSGYKAPVYAKGEYTLKAGKDKPEAVLLEGAEME